MPYTLRNKGELQIYRRITEGDHVLIKTNEVLPPRSQIVIECGMFGHFAGKVVVALETPSPMETALVDKKKPYVSTKLLLVEDIDTAPRMLVSELIEFYRSYVRRKDSASKQALSTCWAMLAIAIGEHFELTPREQRVFAGDKAPVFFFKKLIELKFPT